MKSPQRYLGGELGVSDSEMPGQLSICLAFPDVYEMGMSYLGFQILYGLLREDPRFHVERAYCPWPDMEGALREKGRPLESLESSRPLKDFDVLGFTLQYELTYTNILTMLDLGKVPLRSADRSEEDPLVIGGGPGAFVPEPLALFFDAFCVGEGEEMLPELLECLRNTRGMPREKRLRECAAIAGVYVPSLGRVTSSGAVEPREEGISFPVVRRHLEDLDKAYYPRELVVPLSGIIHDRAGVEIFRGCTRGCRFCQAGMLGRPVRERSPEKIFELSRSLVESSGYDEVGFVSLATCDYSSLTKLIETMQPWLEEEHVTLSLPSLRIDAFSVDLAERLSGLRKGGLTFAPEAGSQRLRDVINKGVREEDIYTAADRAFQGGWDRIKLYFMMGLPTETEEDLRGILHIAHKVASLGKKYSRRSSVAVSVAGFVPKAHTPFQWEPQNSLEELREKGSLLRKNLRNRSIALSYHDPEQTFLEGVFARGDRSLGEVLQEAWRRGARFDGWGETFSLARWMEAFEATGIDPQPFLRSRKESEAFPWDHIAVGVSREFLWRERTKAYAGELTRDCTQFGCVACGLEKKRCPVAEGGPFRG
jgi:radical SAM family uncharacterized protein